MLMPPVPVVPRMMESPASVGCRARRKSVQLSGKKAERQERTYELVDAGRVEDEVEVVARHLGGAL